MTTVLHTIISEAPNLAESSREKYLRDLEAWIGFAGAHPAGWTRARAQAFYNGLLTKIRPQSANRLWASIAFAARWWAVQENNPDLNFGIIQKAGAQGAEARHALEPAAAIALLDTTAGNDPLNLRDRALIMLGLETGMRRMSLEGARFDNMKTEPYARLLVPIKGHGTDLFSVPLSDAVLETLGAWQAFLSASRKAYKSGVIFRQLPLNVLAGGKTVHMPTDTAIAGSTIHAIVGERARAAGLEHVHPHLFRHTFVTWRTELGATDAQIAAVTGHTLRALGALGGYKDLLKIGATSRTQTPPWIAAWRPS